MANYEFFLFFLFMQRLIDKFTIFFYSVYEDDFSRHKKRGGGMDYIDVS